MSTGLPFTKMHGLGNDFIVMDARTDIERDWVTLSRAMCDRHFGVGADQLLLVRESGHADLRMQLFNTDGFEAEMCGNGIRCVGKFAYERGIVNQPEFTIETLGGIKRLQLEITGSMVSGARVSMGVPRVAYPKQAVELDGSVQGIHCLELTGIDMGNPHAVAFLDTPVSRFPLEQVGPLVERHRLFPDRTNFEIVQVDSRQALTMRVWERSVGITLACGTGACAVTAAARLVGLVDETVSVNLPGGTLTIAWGGVGEIIMSGPATKVFEGFWPL